MTAKFVDSPASRYNGVYLLSAISCIGKFSNGESSKKIMLQHKVLTFIVDLFSMVYNSTVFDSSYLELQ